MKLARLKDALRDESPASVFACTYGLDPEYFEQEILPAILPSLPEARNAGNTAAYLQGGDTALAMCPVVVCCDHTEPGRQLPYQVIRVRPAVGAFHPKLLLVDYGHSLRAIVSSANLTRSGWSSNFEMFVFEDLPPESPHPWGPPLLRFVTSVQKLAADEMRHLFEEPKRALAPIQTPRHSGKNDPPSLLSTFEGPLIDRLLESRPDGRQIHAVTPFLEGDEGAGVFDRLRDAAPRTKGTLYVRAEDGSGAPIVRGPEAKLRALLDSGSWELRRVLAEWPDDEDAPPARQLHGKLLAVAKGSKGTALVGSANVTRAALLQPAARGNVELCALMEVSARNLERLLPESEPLDAAEVHFAPAPEDEEDEKEDVGRWVELATYDCGTGRLELRLQDGSPALEVSYESASLGTTSGPTFFAKLKRLGKSLEVIVRDDSGNEGAVPLLLQRFALLPPRGMQRDIQLDELLEVMAGTREPVGDPDALREEGGPAGGTSQLGGSSAFAWRRLIRALAGLERDLVQASQYPIEIERLLDGPLGAAGLLDLVGKLSQGEGFTDADMAFVIHQLRLSVARATHRIGANQEPAPPDTTHHLERWRTALSQRFEAFREGASPQLAAQLKVLNLEVTAVPH